MKRAYPTEEILNTLLTEFPDLRTAMGSYTAKKYLASKYNLSYENVHILIRDGKLPKRANPRLLWTKSITDSPTRPVKKHFERPRHRKINENQVLEIRERVKNLIAITDHRVSLLKICGRIAPEYNLSDQSVYRIAARIAWAHI